MVSASPGHRSFNAWHSLSDPSSNFPPVPNASLEVPRAANMSTKSVSDSEANEYRLPTNVKPTHYDLTIRTDLDKFQFEGFVKIRCVFGSPLTRSISLISFLCVG